MDDCYPVIGKWLPPQCTSLVVRKLNTCGNDAFPDSILGEACNSANIQIGGGQIDGSRYISFPKEQLVDALKMYSPLTLVQDSPKATGGRGVQKQDGETDLPVRKKMKQTVVEAKTQIGGGGGESNSPSKRSYPEFATSLVNSFVLPD